VGGGYAWVPESEKVKMKQQHTAIQCNTFSAQKRRRSPSEKALSMQSWAVFQILAESERPIYMQSDLWKNERMLERLVKCAYSCILIYEYIYDTFVCIRIKTHRLVKIQQILERPVTCIHFCVFTFINIHKSNTRLCV